MLNLGIIGLGKQSMNGHIPAVGYSKLVRLICVCDNNGSKIAEFKQRNPYFKGYIYKDFHTMIEKENIDIVIIALPHNNYQSALLYCAKQGINILKEKPFARNYKEALQLKEITDQYNIKMMIASQRRFDPRYLAFKSLVAQVGEIRMVKMQYTIRSDSPNSGWRSCFKESGGGVALDMGYHFIDLLIWYFDTPDSVIAHMTKHPTHIYETEDTADIQFSIKNIYGKVFISCIHPQKTERIIVTGENGTAVFEGQRIEFFNKQGKLIDVLEYHKYNTIALTNQINHFANVVQERIPYDKYSSPTFQLDNHVKVSDACYKSSKERRRVYTNEIGEYKHDGSGN